MKRSEMIQDLACWLICETLDYCQPGIPFDKAKEIADTLLSNMEQAGMRPPDISFCNCEDCGGPSFQWDGE